jgi:hypothetical protein
VLSSHRVNINKDGDVQDAGWLTLGQPRLVLYVADQKKIALGEAHHIASSASRFSKIAET